MRKPFSPPPKHPNTPPFGTGSEPAKTGRQFGYKPEPQSKQRDVQHIQGQPAPFSLDTQSQPKTNNHKKQGKNHA